MAVQERLSPGKYRLSVDDYLRLGESGAFGGSRTELIEGDIIVMSPACAPHAKLQARLAQLFAGALDGTGSSLMIVLTAPSVLLRDDTMPEPDIVVADDHDRGPLPLAKVRLIVEVADATLSWDLGEKQRLYAAAGVAEYWVASVNESCVHQFWDAAAQGYLERRTVRLGEPIVPATVAGLAIATDRL